MMVDSVRKMKDFFERALANLEKYSGIGIPIAPKSLEGGDVGLKFQTQNVWVHKLHDSRT